MSIFPAPIRKLPEADIPLEGVHTFLSQGSEHQIIFMEFEKDVELQKHQHESQIGFVLEGEVDLIINGLKKTYKKGDIYYIPRNTLHSGHIYAGYADITFFDQKDRYKEKALRLMADCELLPKCAFFNKYKRYSGVTKCFIEEYCKDITKSEKCQRKILKIKMGVSPPEDLMPNGKMIEGI
jgi:hypothetical protein